MHRFKIGDRVICINPITSRAKSHHKQFFRGGIFTIDKFCSCCDPGSEYGREVDFKEGGYYCNEIDLLMADYFKKSDPPKTEIEWLDRVRDNFKE